MKKIILILIPIILVCSCSSKTYKRHLLPSTLLNGDKIFIGERADSLKLSKVFTKNRIPYGKKHEKYALGHYCEGCNNPYEFFNFIYISVNYEDVITEVNMTSKVYFPRDGDSFNYIEKTKKFLLKIFEIYGTDFIVFKKYSTLHLYFLSPDTASILHINFYEFNEVLNNKQNLPYGIDYSLKYFIPGHDIPVEPDIDKRLYDPKEIVSYYNNQIRVLADTTNKKKLIEEIVNFKRN